MSDDSTRSQGNAGRGTTVLALIALLAALSVGSQSRGRSSAALSQARQAQSSVRRLEGTVRKLETRLDALEARLVEPEKR